MRKCLGPRFGLAVERLFLPIPQVESAVCRFPGRGQEGLRDSIGVEHTPPLTFGFFSRRSAESLMSAGRFVWSRGELAEKVRNQLAIKLQ